LKKNDKTTFNIRRRGNKMMEAPRYVAGAALAATAAATSLES